MNRTFIETVACFIGIHRFNTFNHDGMTFRYCSCGKLQMRCAGYDDCCSWEPFLPTIVINKDLAKKIRTAVERNSIQDIIAEKREKSKTDRIIKVINRTILPMICAAKDLPVRMRLTTLMELVDDVPLFTQLMVQTGYVCYQDGNCMVIGFHQ